MTHRLKQSLPWIVVWLITAAVVASGVVMPADREISSALSVLGRRIAATNLIWVVGGLPCTGLVVLAVALFKKDSGWRVIAGFVVGLAIEVLSKHFIATPFPKAIPEPRFYALLETATNLTPALALHWIHEALGVRVVATGAQHALFRGSFPSGHVFRTTYAGGCLFSRGSQQAWTWMIAGVAGVLVVATGGHWASDVLGGFFLARATLVGIAARMSSPSAG